MDFPTGFCNIPIGCLVKAKWNYKLNDPITAAKLNKGLEDNGLVQNIVVRLVGEAYEVVDGNHRLDELIKLGAETVHCYNLGVVSDAKAKRISIELNETRFGADEELLAIAIQEIVTEFGIDDVLTTFPLDAAMLNPADVDTEIGVAQKPSLQDRFGVPPFSILNAREGIWIERKRQWLDMGIDSEVGRGENLTLGKGAQSPAIYGLRNEMREQLGREPSWQEIEEYAKAKDVYFSEGTSIFDPFLTEIMYRWFVPSVGDTIIDPFAGGSVRGIVASILGHRYVGVDLREEQVEANRKNASTILDDQSIIPIWHVGSSENITELCQGEKADFIFSCPPYADLEVYSDDPQDLSTMPYDKFVAMYRTIIARTVSLLKDDSFACFVVGEVRSKKGGYYNFVGDTIQAFIDAGMVYYNEVILVTQVASLAIRAAKQFNASRKIGKTHQNILVFYKGDLKKIKDKFPSINISDELTEQVE